MSVRNAVSGAGDDRELSEQIAVRLPRSIVERLSALAEQLQAEAPPGVVVRRSDAMRAALLEGLDVLLTRRRRAKRKRR